MHYESFGIFSFTLFKKPKGTLCLFAISKNKNHAR